MRAVQMLLTSFETRTREAAECFLESHGFGKQAQKFRIFSHSELQSISQWWAFLLAVLRQMHLDNRESCSAQKGFQGVREQL